MRDKLQIKKTINNNNNNNNADITFIYSTSDHPIIRRTIYVPSVTHIVVIILEPLLITHLVATQWGDVTMSGDRMKPNGVSGAQYLAYK
jgi:hypothetical protein